VSGLAYRNELVQSQPPQFDYFNNGANCLTIGEKNMTTAIADTSGFNRVKWLSERRKGIGSSDAAAILGLSKWKCAYEVWLDKTGQRHEPDKPTPQMVWGLRHEPSLSAAYEEEEDCLLVKPELLANPKHPWMLANIDRLRQTDDDREKIVELKTSFSREGWGDEGTDEVPELYLVQVTHQMETHKNARPDKCVPEADIAVLIGLSDFRIYTVPYNETLAAKITAMEGDFWRMVETKIEPPPDWEHEDTPKLLQVIRTPGKGRSIELGDAECDIAMQAASITERISAHTATAESLKGERDVLYAKLALKMGNCDTGTLPNGYNVKRINYKPVTVKEYLRSGYVVTKIVAPKGK